MKDEYRRYRELLLFGPIDGFSSVSASIRHDLVDEYERSEPERQTEIARLLADLTIDLGSYLPRWHLQASGTEPRLDDDLLGLETDRNREVLGNWGARTELDDIDAEVASIASSNLRRLSELTDSGALNSRWGHDAATGLTWALRRGAVLVTTNPVMVNGVRKEDPATWDPVRDALKASHPDATPEERVSLMTMNVVLEGCRELRPIWEATKGRYGYVSLQINPRANDDAGRMAEEAEGLYARLTTELGGTPNTRFKIPGTRAGLDAVGRLTSQGIGVTVTVNASVDQQLAFAEVIEQGSAPLSFLTLMLGRLDDPVRDELEAEGLPDAVEASRWAGVAVLRRSYALLYEQRGFKRSAILGASMRGPWTIDGSIAKGPSETFITCFPDKARDYDSVERALESHVDEPLGADIEATLSRSETFRKAYGHGALPVEAFDSFVPVTQTLDQFARNYDEFVDYNR